MGQVPAREQPGVTLTLREKPGISPLFSLLRDALGACARAPSGHRGPVPPQVLTNPQLSAWNVAPGPSVLVPPLHQTVEGNSRPRWRLVVLQAAFQGGTLGRAAPCQGKRTSRLQSPPQPPFPSQHTSVPPFFPCPGHKPRKAAGRQELEPL